MNARNVSLDDRYDLDAHTVLLSGPQALVRLMLMQSARDAAAGLSTAGYVTGYRGSPLGGVDQQMVRGASALASRNIVFQPGLNEDLAATALWGTQQSGMRGDGTHDGVFGLWYGKGPGVDRSGEGLRHANMAGTAANGGVVVALGDDHTGESSTTCHQSDLAVIDAHVPLLSPAGVQEILDFGIYGFALSRFSGLWAGLKLMKDTVEVTSVVDARPDRMQIVVPDFPMPEGGLNIRLGDHWVPQEERLVEHKRFAAEAFARANRIDKRVLGRSGAKIGFVAAGKNWLDLVHAMNLLGIDEKTADRLGVTTYKVGQAWPLDRESFNEWADGLDLIVVVEEKRKLIEVQIKEAIFDDRRGRRVWGYQKGGSPIHGAEVLFPLYGSLDPVTIAVGLGDILCGEERADEGVRAKLRSLKEAQTADTAPEIAVRTPYYCSGCPHNISTKVPEGSRAYAGIGCHTMALWMDRETSNYTHMGAEGAQWVGESRFTKTDHVFQNLGDGTYNHSGILAIRAALAANTTITYKILYNDAVALTGGQAIDGDLTADRIARELLAMGVKDVAVVFDEKEEPLRSDFPREVSWHPRAALPEVQDRLRKISGVTAILYVQTCAAEKRRRRKRGAYPDPERRIFINPDICEGCGDCGVQSNCVSILPVETELGRKRRIDQSNCNKDYSCINGFCPSFVTVKGGSVRKPERVAIDLGDLPEPALKAIDGTHNVVVTGIGGTGVVTIGALLAMAAHIDGKGASMMEMAGLAQKGGAVHIHCRLAERPEDISAIRVAVGEADVVIGGDLVVTGGAKTLGLMAKGRTWATVSSHEVMTGEFTRNSEFRIPSERLKASLEARLGGGLRIFDANLVASRLAGDTIYANMILLGAAWQSGHIPVSRDALQQAIRLNGASVDGNLEAFEIGRWAALNGEAVAALADGATGHSAKTLEERIAFREDHLVRFQSVALAKRYRKLVDQASDPRLKEAVALGYHKVLAYKDEYEVARLLQETRRLAEIEFEGDFQLQYHLAPPVLSGTGPDGRPRKRTYSEKLNALWPLLARLKVVRGTPLDLFGYSRERRDERRLIREYETDLRTMLSDPERNFEAVVERAWLPLSIRGFGPVKQANAEKAATERDRLMAAFEHGVTQKRTSLAG